MAEDRAQPIRAALHSVGCKLNQFEAELLRQALEDRGYEIVDFEDRADVYILNSCTVTSRTDRECRRLARGARARNPQAYLVLTGCYAEVAREELRRRELADLIVGNAEKPELPALIDAALGLPTPPALQPRAPCDQPLLREFRGHTRAFVKVQEGCAGGCAFCLISQARGLESSVPADRVEQQVQLLARRHPEVVLTGTHLGRYGRDLPGETDLAGLVERLCSLPELPRLRLSSIEPLEIGPALQELVIAGGQALSGDPSRPGQGKVCRHLHIPLQSGCDAVLQRMGRPYDAAAYSELVAGLHARQSGLAMGADVMVGFPGETEAEFEATVQFVEGLPLAYLHVFTFSPRPGTAAAKMPDQIPGHVKKARNHMLRDLSDQKRGEFAASQVGKRLEVVLEAGENGEAYGLSDNYLHLSGPQPASPQGRVLTVTALEAHGDRLSCVLQ